MIGKRKIIYLILLIFYFIIRKVTTMEYEYIDYFFMLFMILYVFFSDRIFDWFKNHISKE